MANYIEDWFIYYILYVLVYSHKPISHVGIMSEIFYSIHYEGYISPYTYNKVGLLHVPQWMWSPKAWFNLISRQIYLDHPNTSFTILGSSSGQRNNAIDSHTINNVLAKFSNKCHLKYIFKVHYSTLSVFTQSMNLLPLDRDVVKLNELALVSENQHV